MPELNKTEGPSRFPASFQSIIWPWLFAVALLAMTGTAQAQIQSMTVAHSGLAPNDTLWAAPGDSIKFIYGGGGPHPMTSGHGGNPSPVFFPTVTVTSSTPNAYFTLTTPGIYWFHCGTNPANSANWGTIFIQGGVGWEEGERPFDVQNPATSELVVQIQTPSATFRLVGMNGAEVRYFSTNTRESRFSLLGVPPGTYALWMSDGSRYWVEKLVVLVPNH
jgi:plastocyanin